MLTLYNILMVVTEHGYAAIAEFTVTIGDQIVTHLIAVIVIKAGVLHIGWRVVKHVRKKKIAAKDVTPVVTPEDQND